LVNSSDLALLVLTVGSHSGRKIKGRTRIQKTVCVLKFNKQVPFNFDFKSYFYGPYSEDLTEAINGLVGMKILKETIVPVGYSYRYEYELTDQGNNLLGKVRSKLLSTNRNAVQTIAEEVPRLERMGSSDLVSLAKLVSNIPSLAPQPIVL
jgi:uncharacterized protein YwgA